MALLACPDCGKDVSDAAPYCPHCGRPIAAALDRAAQKIVEGHPQENTQTGSTSPPLQQSSPLRDVARTFGPRILAAAVLIIALGIGARTLITRLDQPSPDEAVHQPASSSLQSSLVPKMGPKILVTIQKAEYEGSYFRVVGVAQNIGDEAASSPTLVLEIYDEYHTTLLAKDRTRPAGTLSKAIAPWASAAFTHFVSVPGAPQNVRWRVSVSEYPYEIVKEKE